MTLKDIADRVLEHFNHPTDAPSSQARSRIYGHVNYWHTRILTQPGMEKLRQGTLTATATASDYLLVLPPVAGRVVGVQDTANRKTLGERNQDWWRWVEPDPTVRTGTPDYYVQLGPRAALRKPATTGLWAVSSSSSDAIRVSIEGIRTGGYTWGETAVLNGTTRVQLGSLTDWIEVTKCYVDVQAVGAITLYDAAASGNVLAVIPTNETQSQYLGLALWPTPSSALSYSVDYLRRIEPMVSGSDLPLVPEDFHWLLVMGAKVSEYERTDDGRIAEARAELERGIRDLRWWAQHDPGYVLRPGRRGIGISRLGGWTPVDTVVVR